MKLPNVATASVATAKITEYLLNPESSNGRDKARFFLAFGFTRENWDVMANALLEHAKTHEVVSIAVRNTFGVNYVIEGTLVTPDGRNPEVRTIWAIDNAALCKCLPHVERLRMGELERVALTEDLPEYRLKAGDIGMILHVYGQSQGYEVEFVTLNGDFLALIALYPAQIRSLHSNEIAHVREVQSA